MRPEKSKLLKISLCVLSCVFFGCGDNKSNGGGAGKNLTVTEIKRQLENNTHGKNAQQDDSPFMKILSNAMTTVLSNKDNTNVKLVEKFINEDGSIKQGGGTDFEALGNDERIKVVEALENIIDAINTEVEKSLNSYKLTDSFDVTENAINAWTEKGLKNKEVAKVISAWQVIYFDFSKFMENPLQFLIKSGKGVIHRSTVKAIDLAWRNFVDFLKTGCDKCENSLNAFIKKNSGSDKDKEVAEEAKNVMQAISADLLNIRNFVENKQSIRVTTLKKVYTLIGNRFLPEYGGKFFGLINVQQANVENTEQKITTDWGNAVFNHFYLGLKSARSSFSNPASALNGNTISKLKSQYANPYTRYQQEYKTLLESFVRFAIDKKIISTTVFGNANVSDICNYLEDTKQNKDVDKISLSPWLMLCAQDNWTEICKIVEFNNESDEWNVKITKENTEIKKMKELVEADKNYEKLGVYAGILALCNLNLGLIGYKTQTPENYFKVSRSLQKKANSKHLKKYVLTGRLKQWDDFKTAAEKGTLKDEE